MAKLRFATGLNPNAAWRDRKVARTCAAWHVLVEIQKREKTRAAGSQLRFGQAKGNRSGANNPKT